MPRPTPIVLPGPAGMGGRATSSDIQIPVGDILKLVNFFQQQKAAEESGKSMLDVLGMAQKQAPAEPPMEPTPIDTGGGLVNMPAPMQAQPAGVDYSPLAKSKVGQDLLSSLILEKNKPTSGAIGTSIQSYDKDGESYDRLIDMRTGKTVQELGKTAQKSTGAEAKSIVREDILRGGQPHTVVYDQSGKELADLGVTFVKPSGEGKGPTTDKFFARMLDYVESGKQLTPAQTDAMKLYMEAKRLTNAIPGMIDPTEDVIDRIFPKGKEKGKKDLTPEIASEYLKKYKTRAEAEKAAKKDGYVF